MGGGGRESWGVGRGRLRKTCERKRFQAPPKEEGKVKCNDFKITVKHLGRLKNSL